MSHLDPRAVRAITTFGAQQKATELSALLAFLDSRRTRTILEIGSWTGGTLWLWSQIASYVVSIDVELRGEPLGNQPAQVRRIIGDSHDEATRAELPEMSFDVLHIDGDHTDAGVRRDYEMYAPLVASDGVVIIHDIVPHLAISGIHVEKFWREVKRGRRSIEFIDPHECPLSEQGVHDAGIGVLT